jgi:hypothetical protein
MEDDNTDNQDVKDLAYKIADVVNGENLIVGATAVTLVLRNILHQVNNLDERRKLYREIVKRLKDNLIEDTYR